jgi:hypothetical protein
LCPLPRRDGGLQMLHYLRGRWLRQPLSVIVVEEDIVLASPEYKSAAAVRCGGGVRPGAEEA